jgi:hypothetical protein
MERRYSSVLSAISVFVLLTLSVIGCGGDDSKNTTSASPPFATTTRPVTTSTINNVDIRVADGGWGDAQVVDIQAVLGSVADELIEYFPYRKNLNPIIVKHGQDAPIVLYKRGTNGEYIVHLNVEGTLWAKFAYQFSHEFTHILARYELNQTRQTRHQWFEESVCVTASLFTLRQMAITWRTTPPYSNWSSYAPYLREYADNEMSASGRQLPSGQTLAEWYKKNESALTTADRDKQVVVASKLLPIFERNPDLWESVSYMNLIDSGSSDFQNYLNNWYISAPEKHKASIREIIYLFR